MVARKRTKAGAGTKSKNAIAAGETGGRPVSESRTEMVEVALPVDANILGDLLGGRVMHLVDIAAAIAAYRMPSPIRVAGEDRELPKKTAPAR